MGCNRRSGNRTERDQNGYEANDCHASDQAKSALSNHRCIRYRNHSLKKQNRNWSTQIRCESELAVERSSDREDNRHRKKERRHIHMLAQLHNHNP